MNRVIFIALVVVALALAEAVYYFVRFLGERPGDELRRRLRAVGEPNQGLQILRRRRKLAGSDWMHELLDGIPFFNRLEALLEQTDLDLTVTRLIFFSVMCAVGGLAVGVVLHNPLMTLMLFVFLPFIPFIVVVSARGARSQKISEQLPEALDMMARSIKAGYALPASFKLVAQESPLPIAVEFAKAYEQQNLGLPFEQAVFNMTDRVPQNMDLKLFAVTVNIQKETGGNLVEVLEGISATMRERFKFYSKLRALTAEGKMSGIILGALPFVMALVITLTNRAYISELTVGAGRTILFGGLISWTLGVLWIRSLLKVEY